MTLQHITHIHGFRRNYKAYCEKKTTASVIVTILCKLPGNYISIRQPTFMIARDGDNFVVYICNTYNSIKARLTSQELCLFKGKNIAREKHDIYIYIC